MRVIHGDCLEVMPKLIEEGIKVDAIICDQPYGSTNCSWDSVIPIDKMWSLVNQLIKDEGVIALFGSEPFSSLLITSNLENYKYDIKWLKSRSTGFQMANQRPLKDYEDILIFYKTQPYYKNTSLAKLPTPIKTWRKGGKGGNLLSKGGLKDKARNQEYTNYNRQTIYIENEHNVGEDVHPTQKPVKLLEELLERYTRKGDLVLDFTCGGGSTAVACKNLGRDFIGIEIEAKYYNMTKRKIRNTLRPLF